MSILKNLKAETKSAWVQFPGLKGFEVHVGAISRDLSRKIKEKAEVTKIDPKHRMPVTEINDEMFMDEFCKNAILGWKGLTYRHLEELMLIDTSGIENLDAEVKYSHEDAIELVKCSSAFDNWLNEQVFSLAIFRRAEEGGNSGAAKKVPG